jgi:hypothetical protein
MNQLKGWLVFAVISMILNFVLLFLLLDGHSYKERVSADNKEKTEKPSFSQEEYNELLNDNIILDVRLSDVLKDYNEQVRYIEELEKKV